MPIVFHVLADPFRAGAGTSDKAHLANVTGVYAPGFGDPEQERRVALIKRVVPKARRIGILFSPDEPYAVSMKDKMIAAGRKQGLEVIAVSVPTVSDGSAAATALVSRKVDAIEIFGNTAHAAFPSIMRVANERTVPVFSPSPFEMLHGATAAIYPDFSEGGIVAGHMIGRIMKGESPGRIPFHRVESLKTKVSALGTRWRPRRKAHDLSSTWTAVSTRSGRPISRTTSGSCCARAGDRSSLICRA